MSTVEEFDVVPQRVKAVQWDDEDSTFRGGLAELFESCRVVQPLGSGSGCIRSSEDGGQDLVLWGDDGLVVLAEDGGQQLVLVGEWVLVDDSGFGFVVSPGGFSSLFERPVLSSLGLVRVGGDVYATVWSSSAVASGRHAWISGFGVGDGSLCGVEFEPSSVDGVSSGSELECGECRRVVEVGVFP